MNRTHLCAMLVILLLGAAPNACAVPSDDAGDVAYVHQLTQMLLGRRPRGSAEIQALLGVLEEHDRATVAGVLMAEPDFVERWLLVLADTMEVQRSGQFKVPTTCFNQPDYLVEGTGALEAQLLADHILLTPSHTVFDPDGDGEPNAWNLNDALRAALIVDDLHVAWRPYLFVLAGKHGAQAQPIEVRDNFMRTALGVRSDCVSCHSSAYSKTEVYSGYGDNTWDRTATFGLALQSTAFGAGSLAQWPNLPGGVVFAQECAGCHGATGNDVPTGSHKSLPSRVPLMSDEAILAQILVGNGYMQPVPLTDTEAEDVVAFVRGLYGGYPDLQRYLAEAQFDDQNPDPAVHETPWGLSYDCGVEWKKDSVTSASRSYSFGGHQESTTDVGDIVRVLRTGLNALPGQTMGDASAPADAALPVPTTTDAAVAQLLALNVTDDVLEELTGNRGILTHGMPRTVDQATLLQIMSTYLVVDEGDTTRLSLKNLLAVAVASSFYNRRAPSESTQAAYPMPMFLNPWPATADGVETEDGDNLNGLGDVVHRRTPTQLLYSLSKDLGWSTPELDPGAQSAYPTTDFMAKLGRFQSEDVRGTTVWQLDSLLFWEQQVGSCENPSGGPDYVDALIAAATTSPTAKVSDVALAMKDRLLQDPSFATLPDGTQEEPLARSLFESALGGAGTFDALASTFSGPNKKAALEAVARQYCGALILTPDYLMANVPTVVAEPTPPVVIACLPGEACTHSALDAHYCDTLTSMGLSCP